MGAIFGVCLMVTTDGLEAAQVSRPFVRGVMCGSAVCMAVV